MTEQHDDGSDGLDGLWRWLVGGLVGGALILGLLVAAYAVGHDRGDDEARGTTSAITEPVATTPPPTTTTSPSTATTPPPETAPIEATPALVAQGKTLFSADGCAACHSLNGKPGAGPSLNGAAGRTVELADGTSVTADDTYLERSITDPDAEIVKGFNAGIMSAAIAGHDLGAHPSDVRALVAFIKAQT